MAQLNIVNGNAQMNDLLGKFLEDFAKQQGQGIDLNNKITMTGYERYLDFNKTYQPQKEYKAIAEWYAKNKKTLPAGVYASENVMTMFYEKIMSLVNGRVPKAEHELGFGKDDAKFHNFFHGLPLFSAWRNSLSVYRIDDDIFEEMLKTPLPDDTPADIFFNLPDFAVYVEFPHVVSYADFEEFPIHPLNGQSKTKIAGFWACPIQKHDRENRRIELELYPNVVDTPLPMIASNSIVMRKGLTIEQAFQATWDCYDKTLPTHDMSINFDRALIKRLLAMLLWLCVEQPDIIGVKGEPLPTNQQRYKKHKVSGHFVPPDSPKVYHVGKRLGGEIREYKQKIAHDLATNKNTAKRPHIRRGHWHGYWYGTGQDKQFKPKWLSATFVNAE